MTGRPGVWLMLMDPAAGLRRRMIHSRVVMACLRL